MDIKPSCKSQYTAVSNEVETLIERGFSKKAIYDYYKNQDKIKMSYSAWLVILRYRTKENPFSLAQKPKFTSEKIAEPIQVQGKFHHDNRPYPVSQDSKPQEKNELKVNLISKKTMKKEGN
jgi:hypothetical protein